MDWSSMCKEFGLVGIFAGAIITMFFFLLKWVSEQFKIELTENRQERKNYLCILDKINAQMDEHNTHAAEFQRNVTAEHREMIQTLGRINGYKKE